MSLSERLKTADQKTIGYGLLLTGVIVMIYSVYSMYSVYTGATPVPSIIHMNNTIAVVPASADTVVLTYFIPGSELSKLFNMGLWLVLMIFTASVGWRIGSLGVQMIQKTTVEVVHEDQK